VPTGPRVTLLTLAQDLGISRATVSNAYNRPDQLSAGLRQRILARAAELGFSGPDPIARGLRRGRVGAIGVLVDGNLSYAFSDPVAVLLLDGLAREVEGDGFGLLHAGTARADPGLVASAAVDGWVVQSLPEGHAAVEAARGQNRPMVVLDQPSLPGTPLVAVDDEGGAAAAAQHLLDLGHRRLAVLAMPLRRDGTRGPADAARQLGSDYPVMRRRLQGALAAVQRAGLDPAQVPVMECAANDLEASAAATTQLLAATTPVLAARRPTGLLALSDQLALGALRAARAAGVAVPRELSVVGFDDAPPARHAEPPLTTVAQPLLERGSAAGALLRGLLRGDVVASPAPFPVRLVVRASTGPPPEVLMRG
jgi:DNA-binding LacI/PurR family transcriptional regulator